MTQLSKYFATTSEKTLVMTEHTLAKMYCTCSILNLVMYRCMYNTCTLPNSYNTLQLNSIEYLKFFYNIVFGKYVIVSTLFLKHYHS